MPRLAAQRCVLHPKATLLLQNIINEPSQQVPLKKGKKRKKLGSVYVCTVCECACVCVHACKSTQTLNGKKEGDGERIREGSRGVRWPFNLESLMGMTHIWLPKTDSAPHAIWQSDPSFFFFLLSSPSFCIPSLSLP